MPRKKKIDEKIVEKEEVNLPSTTTIGYRPHQGQLKIHNAINNTDDKYFIVCNGRQWGV